LKEECAKVGLYYVGPSGDVVSDMYYIMTNIPVKTPYELKGQTLATFATLQQWLDVLGITPAMMAPGDRYTAVEQGVADGMAGQLRYAFSSGNYEVLDYWIDHGIYSSTNNIMMNLDRYNSLPEHLQNVIDQAYLELEKPGAEMASEFLGTAKKQLIAEGGMTPITFSPEDAKYYVDIASTTRWEFLYEKYPEWAPKIFELWGKP